MQEALQGKYTFPMDLALDARVGGHGIEPQTAG
jgi:hypothetical protein